MAIIDVVRFDGLKSRDWLIFKYPSDKLTLGAQLIVQEGQAAIFVKGGKVADIFLPGTYTLTTENIPLLRTLINLPFGNKTPFSAEVYFLNTTLRLDINWGTTDPIQLLDPKFHVRMRVRAFGQMGVRVKDVRALFTQLIGGMQQADVVKFDKIKEYYRGILVIKAKTAISDAIITNGISTLEISTKLEQLSNHVREQISPEFERYGLSVTNFFIQSVNFPEEDFAQINRILTDKAAFDIMGDRRYATKRSFDVYEGAATNENGVAGAFAAGAVGLGAGFGMAGAMGQNMANPLQQGGAATKPCASCHAAIPADAKFCPHCGFNNGPKTCACGFQLPAGTKFCPNCGKKVE